jgi:hypothetical protein
MAIAASRVLRALSIVVCVIACLSFLLFAVNRTSTASGQQQQVLAEKGEPATPAAAQHESGFRKAVDEVSKTVSGPVSGLSSSEWGEHALRLVFVLLVFGFAVGYIARVVRIRA